MSYSSLHNHSMYSLLDGYGTPEEMFERANEIGLKAFAITEHGNMYSAIYFDLLKSKYPNIKMIYGCELYECDDISVRDKDNKYFHLLCLVRNEQGRKDLNKIITKSNFEGFYFKPRCTVEDIKPYADNLILTSACMAGRLSREEDFNKCIEYIKYYKESFPHFYLEMQSHGNEYQKEYNRKVLELAKITNTPFVITTDSHAAKKEDLHYQGYLVSIGRNSNNNDKNAIENSETYEGCYMQSEEEIHEYMDDQIGYDNVCVGLENTNKIAEMCEVVNMPFQSPQLPTFPLPEGFKDNYEFLVHLVNNGWKDRGFDERLTAEEKKEYRKRIDYELSVIHNMGFDGYFLVEWDFINYAINNNIEIGKGRGSASGSLVCYCCHITDIDPIKYGLIFERFLNPERVGLPDIDTDIEDRDKVIKYLIEKYGEERVCQIINFSYITPTVAITDIGKTLGFQYNEMKKLSQKFTSSKWKECAENNKELLKTEKYQELFDIASNLSGRIKTVSIHAGGVGIVDTNINDYMPMRIGKNGEHVIQVDKHYIENIGIVKYDLLGLGNLRLVRELKEDLQLDPWLYDINNQEFENDIDSYKLLGTGHTDGVFQVESAGMKDLLVRLQPTSLEDLSAVIALYRPDSMGALEDYIERKTKGIKPTYIHDDMEPILKNTNGCMIYQEQLMEIVRKFGGRSYGGSDVFRKAIGKKIPELVKKESEKLRNEILNNGYSKNIANKIADEMSDKGGYLFNSSHSYSYATLCLETAWFKAHYPVHFFKALLNLHKDQAGSINKYILDAKYFNVDVLPPDINKSEINFSVNDNKVLFGLSAIAGIGETLANVIITERDTNGKFTSFKNLLERVNLTKAQVIALIKSGAIPCKDKKKTLVKYLMSLYVPLTFKEVETLPIKKNLVEKFNIDLDKYIIGGTALRPKYDKEKMLNDYNLIRKDIHDKNEEQKKIQHIESNSKYLEDEDFWEFQTLQVFINNNPFDEAYKYLKPFEDTLDNEDCVIPGIIAKVQKKKDKGGKQFAYINIYSSFGLVEGIVWHSKYKEYEDLIKKGSQVTILCKKDSEDKIIVKEMREYDKWLKAIIERNKHGRNN